MFTVALPFNSKVHVQITATSTVFVKYLCKINIREVKLKRHERRTSGNLEAGFCSNRKQRP